MTLVNVNCTDQTLTVTSRPQIASGGVNEDRMEFSFCAKWDGYAKTAVFYRTTDEVYHVLLDENDTCVIPKEVLLEPGLLHFGVFGVNGDTVRTSAVQVYSVAEGAITEATAAPDPTPDIYAQLLGAMGDLSKLETSDRSSLVAAINEIKRTGGSGGGESGTTDHAKLLNRDAADQHPISAVSGLREELDGKQPKGSYLTEETDPTVPDWAKQPEKPKYTAEEVHALPDTYTPPVDTTLTQSGQAADAAVVGQELSSLSGKIDDISVSGISTTAIGLLITILQNGVYTSDQSANIAALKVALTSGAEESEAVIEQIDSVLYIVSGVMAYQEENLLTII